MTVKIDINEIEAREIIRDYISKQVGFTVDAKYAHFEVKSKNNYKSEWENAAFRVSYHKV